MRLDRFNRVIQGGRVKEGTWQMTPRHELQYRRQGSAEELVVSGPLVGTEPKGLVFRAAQRSREGDVQEREVTLRGRWETDSGNRLSFHVYRQQGQEDLLTLEGGWEIGPRQEILYRFGRSTQNGSQRGNHLLRFQGYWEIDDDRRLTYVLDRASDSAFRFRGTFQTSSILSKQGTLRYQIGFQVDGKKALQTVTLFGKWKLSNKLALEFEIPYADGLRRTITLGASYSIRDEETISGRLLTQEGRSLGAEILLSRPFLKRQGEAFVRLRKTLEETALQGGLRFRW